MMLFGGERFGTRDTARVVGFFSSTAQIGAALAGAIFGALLAHYDSFTIIWATCALLAFVRLTLFVGLVTRDRVTALPESAIRTD
jgi:predicted MFS family arabinose efflux permease